MFERKIDFICAMNRFYFTVNFWHKKADWVLITIDKKYCLHLNFVISGHSYTDNVDVNKSIYFNFFIQFISVAYYLYGNIHIIIHNYNSYVWCKGI